MPPDDEPWFAPEEAAAVADFWAIYDANISLGAMMRETREAPALAAIADDAIGIAEQEARNAARMREVLRRAFAGEWAPYVASLHALGATYARQGFTGWNALMTTVSRRLIPLLVTAYQSEPARLSAALIVMAAFLDRAAKTLGEAYLATRDEELRHSEAQLRQSQKMEAFGSLAGGVAHDFNNILSVILGFSDLALDGLAADDPLRSDLDEIHGAAERAAALTRQLLAFSRRQVLQPRVVYLEEIVLGVDRMLRRLIGEDIELVTNIGAAREAVKLDPGQIEQIIVNLAVNARDAMPRGGTLTIGTAVVDTPTGRNVLLTIADSGSGMSEETQARIFEPFFTTKGVGKGTGLGLSTVFGIVRQSGGTINVESELGRGTTFSVRFPVVISETGGETVAPPSVKERVAVHGDQTILLVEDDEGVRNLAQSVLVRAGYQVIVAPNGREALEASAAHTSTIDLLLTDVVMPHLSGRELADVLRPLRPTLKILFMSGYTDDAIMRHGILESTIEFLPKPITPETLLRKVREVLDAQDSIASAVAGGSTSKP